MTEPNKQEFVSASLDANKQSPAEAGQHSCKNSEAIKEGAVYQTRRLWGRLRPGPWMCVTKEESDACNDPNTAEKRILYTSQTTATQAAVAAAMRKCAVEIEKAHITIGISDFHSEKCFNNGLDNAARIVRSSIPAEANAALDAYLLEKCMEVAYAAVDLRANSFDVADVNLRAIAASKVSNEVASPRKDKTIACKGDEND
jgi:hypothetical protein